MPQWIFPNHSGEDKGLNDSGIESFRKESSLARETAQNIVDARSKDARKAGNPAIAEYEYLKISKDVFPDHDQFREIMQDAAAWYRELPDDQSHNGMDVEDFFDRALELLGQEYVPAIRIRDRNTTGLLGYLKDRGSNFYRLLQAQGIQGISGEGAGTFGIGQRAPFAFSKLRTILYYSKTKRGEELFTGKSILCTFVDRNTGKKKYNKGWFGKRDSNPEWRPIRNGGEIHNFYRRDDIGTDLYVTGFDQENWVRNARESIISNFFASILQNNIKFRISREGDVLFEINADNIQEQAFDAWENAIDEGRKTKTKETLGATPYFIEALERPQGGEPFTREIKNLGEVKLYVTRDEEAPCKIAKMRKPGIVVDYRGSGLLSNFAGVFICDSDRGNRLLAEMEDPEHQSWSESQPRNWDSKQRDIGSQILSDIRNFITETLKELRRDSETDVMDVPELGNYLPANPEEESYSSSENLHSGKPDDFGDDENESPYRRGEEGEQKVRMRQKNPPHLDTSIEEPGEEGEGDYGEEGEGPGQPGDTDTEVDLTGRGGSDTVNFQYRSFRKPNTPDNWYIVKLSSDEGIPTNTILKFRSIGESGRNSQYKVDIQEINASDENGPISVKQTERNEIKLKTKEPLNFIHLELLIEESVPVSLNIKGTV